MILNPGVGGEQVQSSSGGGGVLQQLRLFFLFFFGAGDMGDVVMLGGYTRLPIPVDRVLDTAKGLGSVLVLGWTKDGEFYAASSEGSFEGTTYLAQKFIHGVHSGDYE